MTTTKSKVKNPKTQTVDTPEAVSATAKTKAIPKASKKTSITVIETVTETVAPVDVLIVENIKLDNKKQKQVKTKVVRDSFSFPEQDYEKISELKKACLAVGVHVKKGEILRAGLHLLSGLTIEQLKDAVGQVEQVKTGRRPKD